jgi:hypothetical protein
VSTLLRLTTFVWTFAAVFAALAVPAGAETRGQLQLLWVIAPNAPPPEPKLVKDGELVIENRLLPVAMARLERDLAVTLPGSLSVSAASQLYAVSSNIGEKVFCSWDTLVRAKDGTLVPNTGISTLCFLDREGDGRFDASFEAYPGVGLPQIQMPMPKVKRLTVVDLPYATMPTDSFAGDLWVGLRYEQYFNIYGNRMLMVAYGGRGKNQTLTNFSKFKSKGPFPLKVGALGAELSVLEARDDGSVIRIDRPISLPFFAVVTTTTVRFY